MTAFSGAWQKPTRRGRRRLSGCGRGNTRADHPRHQGLDLGPGAALPRVRVRPGSRRPRRPRPGDPRQRGRLAGGARERRRDREAATADVWSPTGVRLPRPRRAPALRGAARSMLAEDGPGSPTGTRTSPPSRTATTCRTRPRSGRRWSRRRSAVAAVYDAVPDDAWEHRGRAQQRQRLHGRDPRPLPPARRRPPPVGRPPDMRHTEFWSRIEHAPRHRLLQGVGRAVRDRRARAANAAGGAGRRRPAQAGVGRGLEARSSCRPASDDHDGGRHRRRAGPAPDRRALVLAQAVGALGITIGIATASLLARDLSGSEEQAGLAQTAQVLGAAVASYLLARLMSRTRPPGRPGHRLPRRWRRGQCSRWSPASSARCCCCWSAPRCSARPRRPTAARGTPPPTSRPRQPARGRCRPWSGRPRSARSSAPTSPGPPGPSRAGWASPSSPARSRSAPPGCCWPPWWSASCCVPTRCWSPARWPASRRPSPPARPGTAPGRRCASARCWASPSPGSPARTRRWSG